MTSNDTLLQDLCQLSDLDFSKRRLDPLSERCIEITQETKGVRKRLPADVLKHYDARISRGKRGAARMRNTTCGGCNLSLPSGQLADLRHVNADLQLCCNCSIYILPELPVPVDPNAPVAVAKAAPAAKKVAVKKPRKPKVKVAEAVAEEVTEEVEEIAAEVETSAEVEADTEAEATPEAETVALAS